MVFMLRGIAECSADKGVQMFEVHGIIVEVFGSGAGEVRSSLKSSDPDAGEYNSAIDAIESLLLAHACSGIDISESAYADGVRTVLEAIGENL
jgi:hypothetical protein